MAITKGLSLIKLIHCTGFHIIWLLLLMTGIATLYFYELITLNIPWLPVSVIGTAVAFYVGFRNKLIDAHSISSYIGDAAYNHPLSSHQRFKWFGSMLSHFVNSAK